MHQKKKMIVINSEMQRGRKQLVRLICMCTRHWCVGSVARAALSSSVHLHFHWTIKHLASRGFGINDLHFKISQICFLVIPSLLLNPLKNALCCVNVVVCKRDYTNCFLLPWCVFICVCAVTKQVSNCVLEAYTSSETLLILRGSLVSCVISCLPL